MATGKTKASHGHGDLRTCKNALLRNSAPTWYYHIMIPRPKSRTRNIGNVIKRRRHHVRNGSDRSRRTVFLFSRFFVCMCVFFPVLVCLIHENLSFVHVMLRKLRFDPKIRSFHKSKSISKEVFSVKDDAILRDISSFAIS